jgi:hypothetical protein
MATPLIIERTYSVQGPNVVAFANVNAAGAVTGGLRIGTNNVNVTQARNFANAILAAADGVDDLSAQASALYQRG